MLTQPSGLLRIRLGDLLESSAAPFQIALQQQTDSVIVPALPFFFASNRLRLGRWGVVGNDRKSHFVFRNRDDRQVGNLLLLRGNAVQRCREHRWTIVVVGSNAAFWLRRIGLTRERICVPHHANLR